MDRQRFILPMLALITVWRVALLPTVELSPDEALGLFYSRHLALWHLEMGALVPWLIKVSTFLFGSSELGVRLFAPVLAFVASVCFWRLCRGLFDGTVAAWATLLLQVQPAFNLASLYLNSAIVGLTCVLAFVMTLRAALHRASPWSRAWFGCALCLVLAIFADWRNALAWLGAVLALGTSIKRRHHLVAPGFVVVTISMLVVLSLFLVWNVQHGWPMAEASELEPVWQMWPNYLRWLLLASPLLLAGFTWAVRQSWQWRRLLHYDASLLILVGVVYAFADFLWGPRERWPHVGFAWWMLAATGLLAHQSIGTSASVRRKVLLRTSAVLLAALQSLVLMRTDVLRSARVRWPLQTQVGDHKTYHQFYRADPSSAVLGWRQSAKVVGEIVQATSASETRWFVIANTWQLAVELDAYLPQALPLLRGAEHFPRVFATLRTVRDQPLALEARYDELSGAAQCYRRASALFVSDDAGHPPPPEIRNAFDRVEPMSVARLMHAGHEVRTLKIFACHGYKPPDV